MHWVGKAVEYEERRRRDEQLATLEIQAVAAGPLQADTGPDGPVDLPSKKLAGLLAYLACTAPQPQPRENNHNSDGANQRQLFRGRSSARPAGEQPPAPAVAEKQEPSGTAAADAKG
jgi:hypothetical protein